MNRRELLLRLATAICAAAALAPGSIGALAKNGGGGSSGSGGGNSGSGSGSSGGEDSGDDGDSGSDDGGGDDDGSSGKGKGKGHGRRRGGEEEHSRARKARNSGNARPLGEVLANVKSRYPGEVVSVSLKKGARLVYRVKLINRQGRLLRISVDAATASIIGVDGN